MHFLLLFVKASRAATTNLRFLRGLLFGLKGRLVISCPYLCDFCLGQLFFILYDLRLIGLDFLFIFMLTFRLKICPVLLDLFLDVFFYLFFHFVDYFSIRINVINQLNDVFVQLDKLTLFYCLLFYALNSLIVFSHL